MNLRKGFGRIYTVLCGVILMGICVVCSIGFPRKSEIDFRYSIGIPNRLQTEKYTLIDDMEDACASRSIISSDVEEYCQQWRAELQELPAKRTKYVIENLGYLVGAAVAMYAIRRTTRWVADGFSGE